jgi:uncharacterized RDD family membrane protein YckC
MEIILASRVRRLGAIMLDSLFVCVCFIISLRFFQGGSRLYSFLMPIVIFAVFQLALLSIYGQTLGKRIVKIRIVLNGQGGLPGFYRVVVLRTIVNLLLSLMPFYQLIDNLFIFRGDKRCIHDLIAGTVVEKI